MDSVESSLEYLLLQLGLNCWLVVVVVPDLEMRWEAHSVWRERGALLERVENSLAWVLIGPEMEMRYGIQRQEVAYRWLELMKMRQVQVLGMEWVVEAPVVEELSDHHLVVALEEEVVRMLEVLQEANRWWICLVRFQDFDLMLPQYICVENQ